MKKILLSFILFFIASSLSFGAEPTTVSIDHSGKINWLYFDLKNQTDVQPLTGLYLKGNGEVKFLRLNLMGSELLLDEYGQTSHTIQGPYEVEWNSDNKIERIRQNYTTLFRFQYDSKGRLEKIKDGDYNTGFRLVYSYDGQLEKLDNGNYEYIYQFGYDSDDQIDGIKNDNYDYIWRIRYNSNNSLDEIKNDDYDEIVRISYSGGIAKSVFKTNSSTRFLIGIANGNFLTGQFGNNNYPPICGNNGYGNNSTVQFFEHSNFTGNKLVYTVADYGSIPSGWNDKISSIRIPAGIHVILYEHGNFQGKSLVLHGDWTVANTADFWNDRISSFKIKYE